MKAHFHKLNLKKSNRYFETENPIIKTKQLQSSKKSWEFWNNLNGFQSMRRNGLDDIPTHFNNIWNRTFQMKCALPSARVLLKIQWAIRIATLLSIRWAPIICYIPWSKLLHISFVTLQICNACSNFISFEAVWFWRNRLGESEYFYYFEFAFKLL